MAINAPAVKMFGWPRREMVGKNIRVLLPEPIAGHHQLCVRRKSHLHTRRGSPLLRFLERYLESGQTIVTGTSRNMLGLHRSGYIFPVLLSVKPMQEGFGGLLQVC